MVVQIQNPFVNGVSARPYCVSFQYNYELIEPLGSCNKKRREHIYYPLVQTIFECSLTIGKWVGLRYPEYLLHLINEIASMRLALVNIRATFNALKK